MVSPEVVPEVGEINNILKFRLMLATENTDDLMSDSIKESIRRCHLQRDRSRMDCSCVMKGSSPRVTDWQGACVYVMW